MINFYFIIPLLLLNVNSIQCRALSDTVIKSGHCKHRYLTVDELPHPILLQGDRIGKRETVMEHQLRVQVVYDKSVDSLEESKKYVVKTKVSKGPFGQTSVTVWKI